MTRRLTALLLAAIYVCASAQSPPRAIAPNDFAWQWPIAINSDDGVVRLTLTPEVYAHVTRADLSDLAAFNADDEPIPLGPAALAFERLVPPPLPEPVEVPLFRVPRAAAGSGDRIELHIARGADGKLTRLDAEVAPEGPAAAQDVIVDVSALSRAVTALRIDLDALPAEGLNARIEVAASDDLANWQTLATGLALVSLQENGLRLERTALEIAATERPYLRLRRIDNDAALPLRAVRALPARGRGERMQAIPERASFALQGRADPDAAGQYDYQSAGPFPIERVELVLADANSVAGFVLESRAGPDAAWIERARGTAFRLGNQGTGTSAAPIEMAATRDSHWRVRSTPALARAPTLNLSWRPEQYVLLTQGRAPYRLAAGSANARAPNYPLRTVLSEMRAQHGDLWLPPEAALGASAALGGDAALSAPPAPPPYKQWLLWGVLLAAALGVIVMVLKLMKSPSGDEPPVA
jgi:hypothetical protein